jgi:hypothetical protein
MRKEDILRDKIKELTIELGYECIPEKKLTFDKLHKYKKGAIRKLVVQADLAVYKNGNLICLVECKYQPNRTTPRMGLQYKRYLATGIPFIYCLNDDGIDVTIEFIQSCIRYL